MALDEPKNTDDVYDIKNHKIIVDKEIMKHAESIKIDFTTMGFQINSKNEFEKSSSCS